MTITAVQCRCCGNEMEYEGCVMGALESASELAALREAAREVTRLDALLDKDYYDRAKGLDWSELEEQFIHAMNALRALVPR